MINGELSNVAISVVEPERGGMALGINNTMRQLGFGVGIAGLGALVGSGLASSLGAYGHGFIAKVAAGDLPAAAAPLAHSLREAGATSARGTRRRLGRHLFWRGSDRDCSRRDRRWAGARTGGTSPGRSRRSG
ncbi:MAG: hypothetical protein ACOZDY_19970 [Pseudomonadota bacterium]